MPALITVFRADGTTYVLTQANTKEAYTFLGLSSYMHNLNWIKLAAGVPDADLEIIRTYDAAVRLGFVPSSKG